VLKGNSMSRMFIQKVGDKMELDKPAAQTVLNDQ